MSTSVKRKLFENDSHNIDLKSAKLLIKNHQEWSTEDVAKFLQQNDLKDVVEAFKDHKVDGRSLGSLTPSCLKNMGISEVRTQSHILYTLRSIQRSEHATPFAQILHKFKVFNDPIHGHIELHPLCVAIIDTPQFQRLRHLQQLGCLYHVYPGGTHKRFEHSIGVSHLAGQLVRILQTRQPELKIFEQDLLCVEIAGLCHDLGHGPFSHMYDGRVIPKARPGFEWAHEDASAEMFMHLVESNNLRPRFKEYGLNDQDLTFICEQIKGPTKDGKKSKYIGRDFEKHFLYEIVANKRNGIDVDKWDYFARDCHGLGVQNNFDHQRFMKFVRVIEHGGEKQICSRDKEVHNVYDMFYTRSVLHKRAYQHRVSTIVEEMVTEAMLLADAHIEIKGKNGKPYKISTCMEDMEAYTKLTDDILYQIKYSDNEALKPAQAVLERIDRRQLYPFVAQGKPDGSQVLKRDTLEEIKEDMVKGFDLEPGNVILDIVEIDYGMKDKNPMEKVLFYRKNSPDKAYPLMKQDIPVSNFLPTQFSDQCLRMYVKEKEMMAEAEKAFDAYCQRKNMKKQMSADQLEGRSYSSNQQTTGDDTPPPPSTSDAESYFRTPE